MGRSAFRTAFALVSVLSLLALAGCGGSSPKGGTSAPATTSTSAETGGGDAAPAALPPAPSDVSGMKAWFAQAYPKAAWLSRIKSIEYVAGDVPDSGGYSNAVIIKTDLDYATEQPLGQQITAALGEAHITWAKQCILWFADGKNMMAGDIFDPTP